MEKLDVMLSAFKVLYRYCKQLYQMTFIGLLMLRQLERDVLQI